MAAGVKMKTRILVIDDDREMCELLQEGLQHDGWSVEWRTRGDDGLALIEEANIDVVITDVNLEHMSGHDLCRKLSENRPDIPVIVITAFGDMSSAIAAIRAGAYDFINKPVDLAQLAVVIERGMQHRHLREEVKRLTEEVSKSDRGTSGLWGESRAMAKVHDLIRRIANTDTTVLISGESGTGKELVARGLHAESARSAQPFVAINCAAVPSNLLESELFGHVKGAFTDAKATRKGLLEQATGGSLLLDEVGELPLDMQPKLLRVLQERQVRPVGGNEVVPVDARIIAATNRDLESEVKEGRFREDLYYRLNVVQIHLPPLRARGNDVLLLAQHFITGFAARMKKDVTGISSEAAKVLLEYAWPGNVRQLENSMERAVALTRFQQITVDDLPERITSHEGSIRLAGDIHVENIQALERRHIERVLQAARGNKTRAAKLLGVDRRTLYRKLERDKSRS